MSKIKQQDQRSLAYQLQDVWKFARKEKMYDAADFIVQKMKNFKVEVLGKEIRVQPLVSQPGVDERGGPQNVGGDNVRFAIEKQEPFCKWSDTAFTEFCSLGAAQVMKTKFEETLGAEIKFRITQRIVVG